MDRGTVMSGRGGAGVIGDPATRVASPLLSWGSGPQRGRGGMGSGHCLSTRRNKVFRRIRSIVTGDHIDHIEARRCVASVEAGQGHWDKLWSAVEGHALAVVEDMLSNARGFTIEDVGDSPNVTIVTHV